MKRIIVIAALAVQFLISCRRDGIPGADSACDEIGFSPYVETVRTKVNVHDVVNYDRNIPWSLKSFKVAAYLCGTDSSYFDSDSLLTASAVVSGAGTCYKTANTYYWPTTSSLDFYAYASAFDTVMKVSRAGVCTLGYRVSTNPADSLYGRDDLVVACVKGASNSGDHTFGSGISAQSLTFRHAMAKVNRVSFKAYHDINQPYDNANYRFTVVEVALDSVQSRGRYDFSRPNQRWTGYGGYFRHTFSNVLDENTNSNCFLGSDTTKCLRVYGYTRDNAGIESRGWTDDKFILIPQSAFLCVTYKVEYMENSTWAEVMDTTTKSAMLHFEEGKAYNVKVILTNDGMAASSAAVDDWEDEIR